MSAEGSSAPTLLAIGAHPDDLEIGAAGTLMRWAHRYQLVFAVATYGERCLPSGANRVVEAEKVAAGFGATLEVIGLPDGDLGPTVDVITALEALDARYAPTRVLVPARHDSHQDHRRLGRAAISAFRRIDEVFAYESQSTEEFSPSYFVDISTYIDRKCEIIEQYQSQAGKVGVSPEYIRSTARHWSLKSCQSDGYVEAFEVLRFVERDV